MNAFGWIKDPGSALTHFIGLLMAAAGAWPLLGKTAGRQDKAAMVCMLVFIHHQSLSRFFFTVP